MEIQYSKYEYRLGDTRTGEYIALSVRHKTDAEKEIKIIKKLAKKEKLKYKIVALLTGQFIWLIENKKGIEYLEGIECYNTFREAKKNAKEVLKLLTKKIKVKKR